jgi:hypothetical protein
MPPILPSRPQTPQGLTDKRSWDGGQPSKPRHDLDDGSRSILYNTGILLPKHNTITPHKEAIIKVC